MHWSQRLAFHFFWLALVLVAWAELTPHPPGIEALLWDKLEHFSAYGGLAVLAIVARPTRRATLYAILGLILLGGALEILQGYTGRDADIRDEIANSLGVLFGSLCGWVFVRLLRTRTLVDRVAPD